MNNQFQFKGGSPPATQSGYTILEGLMAVVVVSVMLLAIGPVIAFSVGTRVQAKRVELATQAARSYIDGVKSEGIPAPTIDNSVKPKEKPVPTDITELYCVDFDGDKDNDTKLCETTSPVDMFVQGIAYNGCSTDPNSGYLLDVRVYRANSFDPSNTAGIKQPTAQAPLTADSLTTNALGNRSLPMVQMTTEVVPKDTTKISYKSLQSRLSKQYDSNYQCN
ncbi:hormogonium polysaccharide secretion pseudopilin HpsB [Planktothrix agardhii 1806]|jgi:type II secretory pathway pseudopilin PulG|uniref:hormogonium polysaccharide secretion pseudopilin HpsB n=1 Tax=Planktothrix agardhii TaxID=1160 RepID=UPI001F278549|nr:hormogonium polysaccharide secretion pseudopilin HpsB [Planktothrix agardhii]MCF3569102.1 hormogonium polysaccharide secretion pseudopilin HpsB [Planktothrix agardhii 1807]MCF3572860.1 hormogonium polysaccharide secretion pseudopilin HpsB [Planktothrix agardhii 1805]MCF3587511.1 hormogonium polysaccharide secretion pseudopilin HpsB [Planktothrix agardhii 1803]MCF3605005.1 hormogonium polysaccharide secretion pseudopilin HpsB [Planktothrix agardhii 1804]MCF3618354.1 hormogonium polysaccharid